MMMTYLLAIQGIKALNLKYFQTLIKPRKHKNPITSPTDGYTLNEVHVVIFCTTTISNNKVTSIKFSGFQLILWEG